MSAPGSSKPASQATGSSAAVPAPRPGTAPWPGTAPEAGSSGSRPPGPPSPGPRGATTFTRPRPLYVALAVVAGVAVTFALVVGVVKTTPRARSNGLTTVPDFSLTQVGGSTRVGVPLDGGANGRPAILLFFASWCGPCHTEIPRLARVYARQHAGASRLNRVAVIGVDGNDPTQKALAFMDSSGVKFPVGADAIYTVTEGKFGFSGLPESVFVEGNGTIAGIHYGALTTGQFVSWERKLAAPG